MSLSRSANVNLERFAPAILRSTDQEIDAAISSKGMSHFRDEVLSLGHEGSYSAFYAPFDWVNERADIVIAGVTPGQQQAADALKVLRRALKNGADPVEAARLAKESASFKGGMRSLGARLMDYFDLHKLFGLASTADLFGAARGRTHYTSALRYPVLKNFGNYSGDRRMLKRPFLLRMMNEFLAEELAGLPDAWIVPFGPVALMAIDALATRGIVKEERVLGGILHPGGQQWNRYKVQLGLVDEIAARNVPGGTEVLRRTALLQNKVREAINRPAVAAQ